MSSQPPVYEFTFDADNQDKIARHGLTAAQVDQVLDNDRIIIRNRAGKRATHVVIGLDNGGACITIPVEPTRDPEVWRPVTAFVSDPEEKALLG